MLCFDNIDSWAQSLASVLLPLAPTDIQPKLQIADPEFVEDARDLFLDFVGRDLVIDAMLKWVSATQVAGYHGTRLTAADVASIRTNGLVPLKAASRQERLKRALSKHSKWNEVADSLDATIYLIGPGSKAGRREDQVHLTLSRIGLTKGFNHYLTHGAEFDSHVAFRLLGEEGKELLRTDGIPYVIQVEVPGEVALAGAHPHFSIHDVRNKGEVPNIINEFLQAWCFRLVRPGFQSRKLRIDCGMMFKSTVPANWIRRIDRWAER